MSDDDVQQRVQATIDRMVAGGAVGLQVVVLHDGRVAVDAVSGPSDGRRGSAVAPDTLFFAASAAKGVASAVAHVLVERGELAYDMRARPSGRVTLCRSGSTAVRRTQAGWCVSVRTSCARRLGTRSPSMRSSAR